MLNIINIRYAVFQLDLKYKKNIVAVSSQLFCFKSLK